MKLDITILVVQISELGEIFLRSFPIKRKGKELDVLFVDPKKLDAFHKALDWWENLNQYTVEYMEMYCDEPYTTNQTKEKLIAHYGDDISFHNYAKHETIVTFQYNARDLLDHFFHQKRRCPAY